MRNGGRVAVSEVAGRVCSVNVGVPRDILWRGRSIRTAIWKSSIGDRPALVEHVNVENDEQADRSAHGGPDKAVYAYALDDHVYWRDSAGLAVEYGRFGENLTIADVDLRTIIIGTRWRVGSAVLEIAQPRLPCSKLGLRMSDVHFPKRFFDSGRLGAYLRILRPGIVRAGDDVEVEDQPTHGITLGDAIRALGDKAIAQRVLAIPELAESWRESILTRLGAD